MKDILREGREDLHLDIESFSQYKFINTDFHRAILNEDIVFSEFIDVDLRNAKMKNINMSNTKFINTKFILVEAAAAR